MNSGIIEYLGCNLPLEIICSYSLLKTYIISVMVLFRQDNLHRKHHNLSDNLFLCLTTSAMLTLIGTFNVSRILSVICHLSICSHVCAHTFLCICICQICVCKFYLLHFFLYLLVIKRWKISCWQNKHVSFMKVLGWKQEKNTSYF